MVTTLLVEGGGSIDGGGDGCGVGERGDDFGVGTLKVTVAISLSGGMTCAGRALGAVDNDG